MPTTSEGIVTAGAKTGSGTPQPSSTAAKRPAPAPSAVSGNPAFGQAEQQILAGKPVDINKVAQQFGPNAGLVSSLLQGAAYQYQSGQAQQKALSGQLSQAQTQEAATVAQQQQQAALSQAGVGLSRASLGVEQLGLGQQQALNPVLQQAEVGQYNISQQQAAQGLQAMGVQSNIASLGQQGELQQFANQYGTQDLNALNAYLANPSSVPPDVAAQIQNSQWGESYQQGQLGLSQQQQGIQQTQEAQQQLSNTMGYQTQQYQQSLPVLASQAIATGAGNSQMAQLTGQQNTQAYQYTQGQEQLQQQQQSQQLQQQQEALQQAQLAQQMSIQQAQQASQQQGIEEQQYQQQYGTYNPSTGKTTITPGSLQGLSQSQAIEAIRSATIGQGAEQAQYRFSQQQLANQAKSYQIAGSQLGLSSAQINTQLRQALQTAGISYTSFAASIASQSAQDQANTIASVIQALGPGAIAAYNVTPAKK